MMKRQGENIAEAKILQIGYGIVGRESAAILKAMGIDFDLYDNNPAAITDFEGKTISTKEEIKDYQYILDFTNEGEWLHREDLRADVIYASPGVPYSMDEETAAAFEAQSVHDNLEIGTAIMLGESLFGK